MQTCKKCGNPFDSIYTQDLCDACLDKEQELETIEKRKASSLMLPKHLSMRFENYRMPSEQIHNLAMKFIQHPPTINLYIYGNAGSGKTHLLSAIANTIVENVKLPEVVFYRSVDLLDVIRKIMIQDSAEAASEFIAKLTARRHYLFLDDIGVEKVTDMVLEKLYLLFDDIELYEKKGVAIASNFSPQALVERLGDDRVVDRIVGNFVVVEMRNKSGRIIQHQKNKKEVITDGVQQKVTVRKD